MKNKLKRIQRILLAAFLLISTLCSAAPVFAEETDVDNSDSVDTIIELGYSDEIIPQFLASESGGPMLMATPGYASERLAYCVVPGSAVGHDYVRMFTIDGNIVFCIEPMELFNVNAEYSEDFLKWDDLSESQRQEIWEINYYGYSYPGHQTDKYYIVTQLLIWNVTDGWYDPMTLDGSSFIDISAELAEIESLRSAPQGRPSFDNTTVKTGLNIPVTITDTKGTLGNYTVNGGNGVSTSVNGNNLTVEITSENYTNSITFSRNFSARDVNIIYGSSGQQAVIYLATRSDPTPNFKLNFELLYADIEVTKKDIETGTVPQGDAMLSGAEFGVYDKNNTLRETITTNEEGKATSKKYPIGTSYTIKETKAPIGYLLAEDGNTVDLTFDGESTKEHFSTTIENQVIKGKVEIAKSIEMEREYPFESVIETPGVGFTFDVVLKSSGKKVATLVTDDEGRAITDLLPYGTYVVTEHETEGYDTLDSFEVFIEKDQKAYFYNIYNDGLKAEINVYKTDAETGKRVPAAGIEFKIKDAEGNFVEQTVMYPTKYTTDLFITDATGNVHLPEPLKFGNYFICEIKAPYGYVLNGTEIPLNVDGKATEIFMSFENTSQKGQVYVEKYGEFLTSASTEESEYGDLFTPVYTEKYLDGVTYEITAREDIIGQEGTLFFSKGDVVDTFTTTDEITKSALLQLGSYTITETATKDGFVLDSTAYDFDVEYAGQLIDIVQIDQKYSNDRQKLNLILSKTFEDAAYEKNSMNFKDVLFGVYSSQDIAVDEEIIIPSDSLVGILHIDENGHNIEQVDLPFGKYYVQELATNVGFELDDRKYEFTFESGDSSLAKIDVKPNEIENFKRRLNVEVTKVDADHKEHLLNGAIFEVFDNTTGKYVTTLCTGKLMIKDSSTGIIYEIATDADFNNIIQTVSTDSKNEIILSLAEGTYYSRKALVPVENEIDPGFTINDNPVIKHSVNNGKAILTDAVYGHTYTFKEIVAPTSYQLNGNPLKIEVISERGLDILQYTYENHRIVIPNTGV